jgi:hypothetical protein
MKKNNSLIIGVFCIVSFSTCKFANNSAKNSTVNSDLMEYDTSYVKNALGNVYYLFPSPSEMLSAINQGGLSFKPEFMNSNYNREKYIKANDRFLNLGIYITDLSYCALFARNNRAEDYLETIKKLSFDVNLSSDIIKELINKVKLNVNSVDSLALITNDFFFKIVSDLEEHNRQNDVGIITTGAYIECLYLAVNQVDVYSKDNIIIKNITEQKYAFSNLYNYCNKHIPKEEMEKNFAYIKQIDDAFGRFYELKNKLNVAVDGKYHRTISGGHTIIISEAEFVTFKKNINKIRNSITK